MEKLKEIFGENALTWAELEEKLKDNKEIKLANLASGNYVDRKKFDDKVAELATANSTISGLQDTVKKFDGVDVDKLKKDAADWEAKYNHDVEDLRITGHLKLMAVQANAHDPDLVVSLFDRSTIKRDGDKVIGAQEQFDKLKTEKGFLFGGNAGAENNGNGGARVTTGGNHTGNHNADSFLANLMKGAGLENEKE